MQVKGLHIGGVQVSPPSAAKPAIKPKEEDQDAVKISVSRASPGGGGSVGASAAPVPPISEGPPVT